MQRTRIERAMRYPRCRHTAPAPPIWSLKAILLPPQSLPLTMPFIRLGSLPRRISKPDLLAFLELHGGLDRRRVGQIALNGHEATIEVPEGWPSRLVKALDGQPLGDRRVRAWAERAPDQSSGEEDHFARLVRLLDMETQAAAQQAAQHDQEVLEWLTKEYTGG